MFRTAKGLETSFFNCPTKAVVCDFFHSFLLGGFLNKLLHSWAPSMMNNVLRCRFAAQSFVPSSGSFAIWKFLVQMVSYNLILQSWHLVVLIGWIWLLQHHTWKCASAMQADFHCQTANLVDQSSNRQAVLNCYCEDRFVSFNKSTCCLCLLSIYLS